MNTRLPSFAEVNPKPDTLCIIHTDTLQVLQPAQKHSLRAQLQGTVTEIMEVFHLCGGARTGENSNPGSNSG